MLVLTNAQVFDGVKDELLPRGAVLIEDGKILDVLPGCTRDFENSQVIDGKGGVIAPGFIDCHIHMTLDEIPDKERLLNYQSAGGVLFDNVDSYIAYRSVEFARKTLEAGFTTVVDGGGVDYIDVAMRDAINLGYIEGPSYYISGKHIIAWPSSHFRGLGLQAWGADGMRKAVREQIYYGVDQIKLEMSAPLRSVGRSLEKSSFTLSEIEAAVEEAHSLGLLVSAHARGAKSIKDSLLGGVDLICHGTGMDEEGMELMIKKGAYLLPTLASPSPDPEPHIVEAKSSRVVEILRQTGIRQWESVREAYRAGVKIVLSTDAGGVGIRHGENAREMLRMKELGMSNLECLQAATSEAAKAMNLSHKVGRVEKGLEADLVVLGENPLENLDTVCDVRMVIKSGKVVFKKNNKGEGERI